jgi:hypothetical protein
MRFKCEISGTATWYMQCSLNGAVIMRDAFAHEFPSSLPLFYNHTRQLGTAQIKVTRDGIDVTKGTFILDTSRRDDEEIFNLFRYGLLRGLSVSYFPDSSEGSLTGPRVIHSARLVEVSLVEAGANRLALVRSHCWRPLTYAEILQGG